MDEITVNSHNIIVFFFLFELITIVMRFDMAENSAQLNTPTTINI